MPRLNTLTYLHYYYQLKELWLADQDAFSYLSPTDQLALHKYFQFASDKTKAELIEHRRDVTALDPSLPHRAGRAYAKLVRGERSPVNYATLPDGRRVSVRVVMRPEPNFRILAEALRRVAAREADRRHREERFKHYVLGLYARQLADAA